MRCEGRLFRQLIASVFPSPALRADLSPHPPSPEGGLRRTRAGRGDRVRAPADTMKKTSSSGDGMTEAGSTRLRERLSREITGDVFFDPFNRGRYATDASFYQIMPAGVVVPRSIDEALRTLAICRDAGRIVTPRGGGTSQCGQTVNDGIVVDFSK